MRRLPFPPGFVWGTATSAYQVEGAARTDGRGESIWDRFTRKPGAIWDGSTGDVSCDHYHTWKKDVALMKQLGIGGYRFSLAWPRVLPDGRGRVNHAGLDFYSRLVDALLEADIEPFVTLYHWDLPQALQERGGWASRATASAFVEYAEVVARRLGDRVETWMTHNEPWCAAMLGHQSGVHAPGLRDWGAALAASHHLLLSHGWAVPVLRAHSPNAEVGIVLNLTPCVPASPSLADRRAAARQDGTDNRWFLDPLHGRGYPRDVVEDHIARGRLSARGMTSILPGDLEAIATPTDFLGVNYYFREIVRCPDTPEAENLPRTVAKSRYGETDIGWEIYPEGLTEILTRVHREYAPEKVYITENGAAFRTGPDSVGRVADHDRIAFLREHIQAAQRACEAGVPLAGYFLWSLLDNFEWAYGYTQRFGIVWVDYETQARTLKDSAHWFRRVVATNGVDEWPEAATG